MLELVWQVVPATWQLNTVLKEIKNIYKTLDKSLTHTNLSRVNFSLNFVKVRTKWHKSDGDWTGENCLVWSRERVELIITRWFIFPSFIISPLPSEYPENTTQFCQIYWVEQAEDSVSVSVSFYLYNWIKATCLLQLKRLISSYHVSSRPYFHLKPALFYIELN